MTPTALFITALVGEFVTLVGILVPVITNNRKLADDNNKVKEGQRCLLRSDMLNIYYGNREKKTIRQYEYENFVFLYDAYKALKGNSFIDKIYEEVKSWEIIT